MPRLPKSKLHLTFDELNGVQVVAGSISLGRALELDDQPVNDQLAGLAEALVSWDVLDDDDQPVPCTLAGLHSLEVGHAKIILSGWLDAITAVPDPLDHSSKSGGTSAPAPFVPTEVL